MKVGATYCDSLEAMLPQCDFVVITCPLTRNTRHLLDDNTLALLKPTATLINVARGQTPWRRQRRSQIYNHHYFLVSLHPAFLGRYQ